MHRRRRTAKLICGSIERVRGLKGVGGSGRTKGTHIQLARCVNYFGISLAGLNGVQSSACFFSFTYRLCFGGQHTREFFRQTDVLHFHSLLTIERLVFDLGCCQLTTLMPQGSVPIPANNPILVHSFFLPSSNTSCACSAIATRSLMISLRVRVPRTLRRVV